MAITMTVGGSSVRDNRGRGGGARALALVFMVATALPACVAPHTKALRVDAAKVATAAEVGAPLTADALLQQVAALARARAQKTAVVEISEVPFFLQSTHARGAAALATMLTVAGKPSSPEGLSAQWLAHDKAAAKTAGSPSVTNAILDVVAAARAQGRVVYVLAPTLSAVLAAVEQGQPVLVQQKAAFRFYARPDFSVLVGVDRAREQVRLHTPYAPHTVLSFSSFERAWARGDYWAVLVLDPARIPSSLDAAVMIKSLAMMEETGAVSDAQAGFARAVQNWPERKTAWLGLASTSRTLGDKALAESTLRELVRREPVYGPGLNNLADFLLQENRPQEAQRYAQRAVSVLDIPETRALLAAVQAALSPYKARDEGRQNQAREEAQREALQNAVRPPTYLEAVPRTSK